MAEETNVHTMPTWWCSLLKGILGSNETPLPGAAEFLFVALVTAAEDGLTAVADAATLLFDEAAKIICSFQAKLDCVVTES